MKYKFLPYNKNLVLRARELRSKQTEAEKFFWDEILKSEELGKYTFLRQKPIGLFIVDFYCSKLKLVIEIDGDIHRFQKVRDTERDNLLTQNFGLRVLRYKNFDILNNSTKILKDIIDRISP